MLEEKKKKKITTNPTIGNFKVSILQFQKGSFFFTRNPIFKTCVRLEKKE